MGGQTNSKTLGNIRKYYQTLHWPDGPFKSSVNDNMFLCSVVPQSILLVSVKSRVPASLRGSSLRSAPPSLSGCYKFLVLAIPGSHGRASVRGPLQTTQFFPSPPQTCSNWFSPSMAPRFARSLRKAEYLHQPPSKCTLLTTLFLPVIFLSLSPTFCLWKTCG